MSFKQKLQEIKTREAESIKDKRDHFATPPKQPSKNVFLYIMGLFSILFSMSTLSSIFIEDNYLISSFIAIFLLLALIGNEYVKVNNLTKLGKSNKVRTLPLIISGFTVLFSLSSIYGIYTTIDKIETEKQLITNTNKYQNTQIDSLNTILNLKLDSINNVTNPTIYEQYNYYKDLADNTPIRYQKDRQRKEEYLDKAQVFYDKLENSKTSISNNIKNQIKNIKLKLESQERVDIKSNDTAQIVKYIISALSLIVEVVIVIMSIIYGKQIKNHELELEKWKKDKNEFLKEEEEKLYSSTNFNEFIKSSKIINLIHKTKKIGDSISKREIKHYASMSGVNLSDSQLNELRSLFINLKILDLQSNNSTILNMDLDKSINKLDKVFSELES